MTRLEQATGLRLRERSVKKSVGTSLLILASLCLLAWSQTGRIGAQGTRTPVMWPAAEITWSDNPAIKGGKIAVLWGDPKTGAYAALKKIPGGSTLAAHTHTYDQKVIALSGTITLAIDGGAPKELGPGSYAFIPGGTKHTAECKAGAECTYFEEQPGASDIKFVEETPRKY